MNLGLHGLLLQVIVSIVQFQHGFRLCSAGEPGYLDFDNLPETNFSCQGKVIGGYYADVEAGCQMFHVCTIGQKDEIMDIKFLCLNGTVFDQETRVCERVDEVDCSKSERFYNLNLELYGNHAVTLSLHESGTDEDDESSELIDDHESQRTTSARPSTTSSTTTTSPRPSISSTTSASGAYQHPNGYPQHYQPQPRFPPVQTSQSKSLYDDKNGGYHHQYIYHTGDHRTNNLDTNNPANNNNNNNNNNDNSNNNNNNENNNNNNDNSQATSYQLFSNQGVSSTTGAPQIHQIRYSSTPATQIQIHNDHQPTVSPIFHATSSTIQTLLNSNANSPALINPIFHNHGIASTTEQFTVHNNNPRETDEYRDDDQDDHDDRRPLEAIQPTAQGKVSKLAISPISARQEDDDRSSHQAKNGQQQRVTTSFLPTPSSDDGQAVRSFYPTPRTSTKSSSSHVTHIHLPPPPTIPHLKPHQITINLPTPDIQRIVQNPSPLLPSQSRVIVTAKASVSDESGRSLNTTQLVTLPLPTIPVSYDDYKEGDESFDPFYRDVPKIRNGRRIGGRFRRPLRESREKRSARRARRDVEVDDAARDKTIIGDKEAFGENRTEEGAKVGAEKNYELDVEKIESRNEEVEAVDDKGDEKTERKNYDTDDEEKLEWDNDEEKDSDDAEKSKTEDGEVKDVDDVGNERSGVENEKPNDIVDLRTMSSRHRPDSGEQVDEKSAIDTKESDGDEYVDDVKSVSAVEADMVDLKTMSSRYRSDSGEMIDKKSAIDTKESDGDEYVGDVKSVSAVEADMVDLKTMSSRYRSDSGEMIDKKSAIDTKESDGDEYVDDVKSVSAVEADMVDLKTMSSRHHSDSGEKVDEKSAIDTKESDGDEYVDDVKSVSAVDTRESDAEEYVDTADETFDSKIFDEPESRTSKEVDTRAVAALDSKYSKDLTNRFEKGDKSSNHEYSNGLGTTTRGPEEESSRFSLLPEVVSPMKSHRRHPTKKLTLKERVPAEEEEEDETKEEDEEVGDEEAEEEEEVADQRKSHNKHSSKKSKTKQRLPVEEEENEEAEEEEEVADRGKSHNKHSSMKLKTKQRLPVEEEDEELEEDEEVVDQMKSHKKHSAKNLKTKQRLPVEEEDEEVEYDEEVADQIKSHNKHSAKKLKTKQRLPVEEEEDEEPEEEEEVVDVRKSQRKHSARKSNAEQRLPEEEEEEEENDQGEEVVNRRKSDRKHSAKKSKKKDRLPAEEEEDSEDRSTETSLEKLDEDTEMSPEKWSEERQMSGEKMYDDNVPESYDYYDSEMDSTSVRSEEEDSAEYSKESPNKIDPHRGNSFKISDEPSDEKSSHRRDNGRKLGEEGGDEESDYDFPDAPATRSNEEVSSVEMSKDYADNNRMRTSHEDSRDLHEDEEQMLRDDATRDSSSELSSEVTGSTEKLSSSGDATTEEENSSRPIDERMSEGVLKFTDEIPSSQGTVEPEQVESSKSVEENSQDYIDDNYEPQSYKEREESPSTTEAPTTEKVLVKETSTLRTEDDELAEEISTTEASSMALTERAETEDKQNDEARVESLLPEVDAKIEKAIEKPIESDETTSAASPTSTTSTTTTTTTTTTSTTTTTTTTARPTPPKLFKPFTLRKSYVYSPPTTTPVPVVIKPRLALLNPKPAKPPKSYNELAPKPVIRKTPLFARKPTVRTTTPRTEVENRESSTKLPVGRTDTSIIEETTSGASTTPIPTTEAPRISSQATVTAASKMEDDNSSVKENHNSSTKENHVPLSTTERFQLSSTMDTQSFTPYPLLVKMTEAAFALEEFLAREEAPRKEEIHAMDRADVENNDVPSASEAQISTTPEASTVPGREEVSSEKPVSSSTEGPQIFEIPAIGATSVSSIWRNHVTTSAPEMKIAFATTTVAAGSEVATEIPEISTTLKEAITSSAPTLASIRAVNRRPGAIKRTAFFNCLDKEMYRYYADGRDCRLFHFCSPGFTSRQVLDFRFVCEEGTAFDEESQSCIHDAKNPRCRMRVW